MTSQRADYFGELQANAALFNLTEVISVPPLDTDSLALVLREPARVLGVGFESDDLIRHVVKSAEDQPGALPLLADLFTDLWERMRERGDGILRVSDRREIIQVGAALSRRADQFLEKNPDKEEAVKRLFTLRLAHVPREGEPVRARWERDPRGEEGKATAAEWALVELLAGPDWRLLVTGEKDGKATAEVAHEVLLKTWDKLKRWLEKEREFLVWRGEADARRKEYEKAGKEGARRQRQALLMGLPLDTAEKWLAARRGDIGPADAGVYRGEPAGGPQGRAEPAANAGGGRRFDARHDREPVGRDLQRQDRRALVRADHLAPLCGDRSSRRYVLTAETERALKPGDSPFRECAKDCPEMVVLPAGSFRMGSPNSEAERRRGEGPVRTVTIAKPFAVGKFEVTWNDWEACVAMRGCDGRPTGDAGYGKGQRPVINVSWDQAKAYVAWLSRVTGRPYRLLSEAEWEYAARGVTSAKAPHPPYPWGNTASHEYANYGTDQCCNGRRGGTRPVVLHGSGRPVPGQCLRVA